MRRNALIVLFLILALTSVFGLSKKATPQILLDSLRAQGPHYRALSAGARLAGA